VDKCITNKMVLRVFLILLLFGVLMQFGSATGQSQERMQDIQPIKTIDAKSNEQFVYAFNVSNADRRNPANYTFNAPIGENWILTIQNNMSYAQRDDAKTIIRLHEASPSEKFVEVAMFGGTSDKFWTAVNTEESGYIKVYERDTRGWSKDESIVVGHGNNQGLSVNNGQRIVTDRLSLDGFKPSYITIYGKDTFNSPLNTYAGTISFDLVFGDPSESPVYYLPFAMLVGVGGLVVVLVVFKKRSNPP
jgi:hypothetical protein